MYGLRNDKNPNVEKSYCSIVHNSMPQVAYKNMCYINTELNSAFNEPSGLLKA